MLEAKAMQDAQGRRYKGKKVRSQEVKKSRSQGVEKSRGEQDVMTKLVD